MFSKKKQNVLSIYKLRDIDKFFLHHYVILSFKIIRIYLLSNHLIFQLLGTKYYVNR